MTYRSVLLFRGWLALVALLAFGPLSPAARAAETVYPLTVVDDAGVETTFTAPPQRIVSLSPGHTETVFALGAGDRLVAVDSYSDYPAAANAITPRLGTFPAPSVETIVSLNPDLVLTLVDSHDATAVQLRESGIPVLKMFPRDFDATVESIRTLGRVLGVADRAEEIALDMAARRDAVVAAVADAERPSVFYEMDASDPTKPYAAGPTGFYGQLLEVAGGSNIFADVPRDYAQVSAESIIARDPQLIILADAYSPYNPQSPALVAARPGWDVVTAVRNGAVYALPADLLSRPGPRLVEGLEMLAYLLHPDRFTTSAPRISLPAAGFPYCPAAELPIFRFGFLELSNLLGASMGEPIECEHGHVATGDTYQQTTKGLAFYRRATGVASFISGDEHWALTPEGLIYWTGESVNPPAYR